MQVVRLLRPSVTRFAEKNVTVQGSSKAPSFFGTPTASTTSSSSQAAAETATKAAAPAGGSWRTRMSSFFVGVAVTAVFGYIRLRQDVWSSTADISNRVSAAHGDVSVLLARVSGLEKRVAELEEAKALKIVATAPSAVLSVPHESA